MGEVSVYALKGIDLLIEEGDFVAIMGASGSGKSTLLHLLGCLDRPTSGEYYLDGKNVNAMSKDEYARIRNEKIGFVFQGFNLLPRMTALENVELPLIYNLSRHTKDTRHTARESLKQVGLEDRSDHEPNQLSGGQQQRTAIARALVNNPVLLLADEPTGNLDSRTSVEIMSVFQELNDQGITILLVTHESDISRHAKRIIEMRDGLIQTDMPVLYRRIASRDLEQVDHETLRPSLAAASEPYIPHSCQNSTMKNRQ